MNEARTADGQTFSSFMTNAEPRLRRALVSGFGPEVGREAAVEALEYGWSNWNRVAALKNPAGYLYRVGTRLAAKKKTIDRAPAVSETVMPPADPWIERHARRFPLPVRR